MQFEKGWPLFSQPVRVPVGTGRACHGGSRYITIPRFHRCIPRCSRLIIASVWALATKVAPLKSNVMVFVGDAIFLFSLNTRQSLSRRLARWSECCNRLFSNGNRPGRIHVVDHVSRIPGHSVAKPGSVAPDPAPPGSGARDGVQTMLALGRPSALPGALPASAERFRAGYRDDLELYLYLRWGVLIDCGGLLYHPSPRGERLAVPGQALRLEVMRLAHDAPFAGHFELAKTMDLVGRSYWWPRMPADVRRYVETCDVCQRDKSRTGSPPGELNLLLIPDDHWQSVSMDFVVELPRTKRGHDAIWVVVDRFSKMVHIAPTTSQVTALDTANLFFERVFTAHGLPREVISDRGPQFSGHFWRHLCARLSIKLALSTAFHPQTDG